MFLRSVWKVRKGDGGRGDRSLPKRLSWRPPSLPSPSLQPGPSAILRICLAAQSPSRSPRSSFPPPQAKRLPTQAGPPRARGPAAPPPPSLPRSPVVAALVRCPLRASPGLSGPLGICCRRKRPIPPLDAVARPMSTGLESQASCVQDK